MFHIYSNTFRFPHIYVTCQFICRFAISFFLFIFFFCHTPLSAYETMTDVQFLFFFCQQAKSDTRSKLKCFPFRADKLKNQKKISRKSHWHISTNAAVNISSEPEGSYHAYHICVIVKSAFRTHYFTRLPLSLAT
jgi:hypothetical protein